MGAEEAFGFKVVVFEPKDPTYSARQDALCGVSPPSVRWEAVDVGGRRSLWRRQTWFGGLRIAGFDGDAYMITTGDIVDGHDEDEGGCDAVMWRCRYFFWRNGKIL